VKALRRWREGDDMLDALLVWIALVAGNFLLQSVTLEDWYAATKISSFQALAIVALLMVQRLRK
jgi:hypothetical protein